MQLETDFIPAPAREPGHLMVVLHGLGDSMEGYRWLPEALRLPWMNYLLVNAPDDYYGGFSWFPYPGERGPAVARSRKLLFELLDRECERRVQPENLFMFGFSQGCLMSVEAGLRYPRRLAGIVGISGWAHEPARLIAEQSPAARHQRFLITHGTHDPLIPIGAARSCFAELQQAGMQIDWREFPKEHTIHGEIELAVIRRFLCAAAGHQCADR